MTKLITTIFSLFIMHTLIAQQVIPLYEGDPPDSKPCNEKDHEFIDTTWNKNGILMVDHITKPTLTIYKAPEEKSNGTAVVICPGGGYGVLAAGHEGSEVAQAFNDAGITAFVLRYRLPKDECMNNKAFVPLMDAQHAIYFVRAHAKQSNIDTHKMCIMGFSARGDLPSRAGTHFNQPVRKELA